MAFRQVQRIESRYISEWRLIKLTHKQKPLGLVRWRAINARNPKLAASLVIEDSRLIDITKDDFILIQRSGKIDHLETPNPLIERGGRWWHVGVHGNVHTYDTPEKHLQPGDVCENVSTGKVEWYDPLIGEQIAKASDVEITREGQTVKTVRRKL